MHVGVGASSSSFYAGEGIPGFGGFISASMAGIEDELRAAGVLDWDTETATLFTVARLRGWRAGRMNVVVDDRSTGRYNPIGEPRAIEVALRRGAHPRRVGHGRPDELAARAGEWRMTEREFVHRGFGGDAGPDDIAPYVVLTSSREEAGAIAGTWSDARLVADHYAFQLWTGRVDGARLTACSTGTGSASTAIAVEELAVLGARTLLGLGATREPLEPGDGILVVEGAFRADAASHGYVREGFPAVPDIEVTLAAVAAVRGSDAHLLHGVVADVDAALDARVGVPPRRSTRAAAIETSIREAGAILVACIARRHAGRWDGPRAPRRVPGRG